MPTPMHARACVFEKFLRLSLHLVLVFQTCTELEGRVATLEAQLEDKNRMLQSLQQLLHESASSHRSLAEELELR